MTDRKDHSVFAPRGGRFSTQGNSFGSKGDVTGKQPVQPPKTKADENNDVRPWGCPALDD